MQNRLNSISNQGALRLWVVLLLVFSVGVSPAAASDDGNAKLGLKLYRQHCRSCHPDGPVNGPAGAQSRTQDQWKRFYRRDKHPDNDGWKSIPFEDMVHIRKYLNDYALGTNQDKCGSCWER